MWVFMPGMCDAIRGWIWWSSCCLWIRVDTRYSATEALRHPYCADMVD